MNPSLDQPQQLKHRTQSSYAYLFERAGQGIDQTFLSQLSGKERLLCCALELFIAQGYHEVSLATISKAAGLAPSAVYKHFAGKEGILKALAKPAIECLEDIYHINYQQTQEMLEKSTTSQEVLDLIGNHSYTLEDLFLDLEQMRQFWLFIFSASELGTYPDLLEGIVDKKYRSSLEVLAQLKQRGFDIPDTNPEELRLVIKTQLQAYLSIFKEDISLEQRKKSYESINKIFYFYWSSLFNQQIRKLFSQRSYLEIQLEALHPKMTD